MSLTKRSSSLGQIVWEKEASSDDSDISDAMGTKDEAWMSDGCDSTV